jgi:hypothetical protein
MEESEYFYDRIKESMVGGLKKVFKEKSRVYSVTDRKKNHLYWAWEVSQSVCLYGTNGGCEELIHEDLDYCVCGFSDFTSDGSFLGLTEDEKGRALKRKSKV